MTAHERSTPAPRARRRRRWLTAAVIVLAVVGVTAIVLSVTPWPSAMVIRAVFERGGAATVEEMNRHVPDTELREISDVAYSDDDPALTLDVFTAAAEGEVRPTVFWVHGGAWISGSAENVEPYMRILADAGYTAIAVNYSLGPEETYPTAAVQLNEALDFLLQNVEELSVDATRIVLAGDSAGAQLASQQAALTTNPQYAALMNIDPALSSDQLVGVVLNCGVYDLRAMADLTGIAAWGFKTALWAYTGTKDWSAESSGSTMSTIQFVTDDFPPTYISGGNGDGLTWLQSIPMAQKLRGEDVEVTELFWPADHEPALPHEYQFHLDLPEAQQALTATLDFLATVTR